MIYPSLFITHYDRLGNFVTQPLLHTTVPHGSHSSILELYSNGSHTPNKGERPGSQRWWKLGARNMQFGVEESRKEREWGSAASAIPSWQTRNGRDHQVSSEWRIPSPKSPLLAPCPRNCRWNVTSANIPLAKGSCRRPSGSC